MVRSNKFRYRQRILRATPIGVALLLLVSAAWAETKVKEPSSNVLARAQDLFVHKRRKEALRLLLDAKALVSGKATEKEAIKEGIIDVATRFLTDKGQKAFELGQSQLPAQASLALASLREAEGQEDGNLQIGLAIIRTYLVNDDCRAAKKVFDAFIELVPFSTELQEVELQLAWCLEDLTLCEGAGRRKTAEQKLSATNLKVNSAFLKWNKGELEKAAQTAKEAVALEPQNPAALYWLWKIQKDRELLEETMPPAQAFVQTCRAKEPNVRRRSGTMIEMCLRSSEVEAYLKSKGVENNEGSP